MKAAMKPTFIKYHAESFELLTLAYEYWYGMVSKPRELGTVGASVRADIHFALDYVRPSSICSALTAFLPSATKRHESDGYLGLREYSQSIKVKATQRPY